MTTVTVDVNQMQKLIDVLKGQVEKLQAECVALRRQVADCQQAMVDLSRANTDAIGAYSAVAAERDDLALRLAAAQDAVKYLRDALDNAQLARLSLDNKLEKAQSEIGRLAAAWQPDADVWALTPTWAQWISANADGVMYADQYEPKRFTGEWWCNQGKRFKLSILLPEGNDWRLAKWQR